VNLVFRDHIFILVLGLIVTSFFILCFFWGVAHFYRLRQAKKVFAEGTYFPHARSQFKVVDGCRLHYLNEGSGQDILLLHGLGANIYCWRKLIPILSQRYRVWAVDLKGFGLSEKPKESSYSLKTQAELLSHFMESEKVKKFTVVGNSMGGAIAIQLGIDRPDLVDHVVLINSAHDPKMFNVQLRTFAKLMKATVQAASLFAPIVNEKSVRFFLPQIYGTKNYEITPEAVRAYVSPYMEGTDSHRAFVAAFEEMLWNNLTENLKKIQSRVLILWGAKDNLLPLHFGENLHKTLPGSAYFVHPSGGHHLQEEEPEWVAKRIEEFL
jgi:pimeloyl-ACP methyl ester carboxylesterase